MINFTKNLAYCFRLSWNSSRVYTILRLIGKIMNPIIGILSSFFLKHLIDNLTLEKNVNKLFFFIGLILICTIIKIVIDKVISYSEGMHNDIIACSVMTNLMKKTITANLELFDNSQYYDKLNSVSNDLYAIGYILWSALDFLSSIIIFLCTFAILSSSNFAYGLLMVATSFPAAIISYKYTKIIYRLGVEQVTNERKKNYLYHISTTKEYAQDIRLFNIGSWISEKYKHIWENIFQEKREKIRRKVILTTILELLPEITISVITVDIAFKVLNNLLTIGDFSFYTGLLTQLFAGIMLLIHSFMGVYENKLKIDNVKSFDEIRLDTDLDGEIKLTNIKNIEFKNVSFKYPNTSKMVLENINLKVENGEKVILVGVNGSGKTTLIKLLLRFYYPTYGEILINNININKYTIKSLRKMFSCYFQNMLNYGFTIRENITMGDYNLKFDAEITRIMVSLNAESILSKYKDGLDTYITRQFEQNGIELSGGENQKVAIARAFFRKNSTLILDEPSSSLDPESEHILFEQLEHFREGKTTFITSHRLTNIKNTDKIVVIECGKIIEIGTKQQLIANSKRFAQLYEYQADRYRE